VIPRLDIKGANLVKGIHLEGLRVLGHPSEFAAWYYEQGADELLYMDVVASLYGRNSLLDFVEQTARAIFIPLTVGGGLRTIEDIRSVLRAGADKVAINTGAIADPEFIRGAARRFGSSTIVVSIEAIKQPDGRYEAFTDNGRQSTGIDAIEWARRAADLGAGEIMITSVDREGTGAGYDLELTSEISRGVGVPVIAHGGAGDHGHAAEVVQQGGADAISLASILHYEAVRRFADDFQLAGEGNTDYLRRLTPPKRVVPTSIPSLKESLEAAAVPCRRMVP
jgi:cyclase